MRFLEYNEILSNCKKKSNLGVKTQINFYKNALDEKQNELLDKRFEQKVFKAECKCMELKKIDSKKEIICKKIDKNKTFQMDYDLLKLYS